MADYDKKERKGKVEDEGTLIRGADGELYFIPDDELQEYRLKGSKGEWAKAIFKVSDEDFEDTSEKIEDLYRWTNLRLRLQAALHGVTSAAVADNSPTKVG